jgi:hypothetical protein
MKKCVAFIILFSLSFAITSCGGGNNKPQTAFSVDAIITEERPLTSEEIQIATRICYAYQSKSQQFRTADYYGTKFLFSVKKTDCQNQSTQAEVPTTMKYDDQNVLNYIQDKDIDSSFNFKKLVQSDRSGYMSQLCPKILTNQPVTNTTVIQNTKVQISFFKETLDGYLLKYFTKLDELTYKIESAEKFKIPTDAESSKKSIRGMDQFYSLQKVCPSSLDKNKFSDFEQNFIYH